MIKMDAERLDIEKTLGALTLDEKLRMLVGDDMWHTFGAAELPRVRMSDGPCGLRMTDGASSSALPATLFPTPSMLANSWDPALLYDVGAAIGAEATAVGVNLLLAPGLNIKRTPLGGRNFEYYSEDPYLSGTLGKAFVSGVQSTGVGACVKHFAANNTETLRMYSDSVIDARALNEIYLKPFEIALEAKPAAVMCAYNKLNSEYCSQNEYLLKTVLRDRFGYNGVTLSDWGAVRDRAAALAAGLDLEMPYNAFSYDDLAYALDSGDITEQDIDGALGRLLGLIDDVYLEPYGDFDADAHDRLAYFAAASSIVMLKNDGILPLTKDMKIAVVGEYAECAPLQGGGSSHVTPLRSVSPLEAFSHRGIDIAYYRGYSADKKENARLIEEARRGAAAADCVVVYVGLPAPQEGADRKDAELPPEQNELVSALAADGRRVAVVLVTPGPVAMPWIKRVRSVLYQGLGGANGSLAAVDVLYGRVNPRGRLAESFSTEACDTSRCGGLVVPYLESIFVGYRRHDRSGTAPLFPFGHGLSFSEISYDGMRVKRLGENSFDVTVTLTNKSTRDGYETVQIYVSDRTGRVMRPEKQLAGYCKVFIEGEMTTETTVHLDARAFEFWNEAENKFSVPDGEFKILAAASAADVRAETTVKIDGDFTGRLDIPESYAGDIKNITDEDFQKLGVAIPAARRPVKGEHTLDSSLSDVGRTVAGRIAVRAVKRRAEKMPEEEREAFLASALQTPLSAVTAMSGGAVSPETALGLVEMANGKFFAGLKLLLKRNRNDK